MSRERGKKKGKRREIEEGLFYSTLQENDRRAEKGKKGGREKKEKDASLSSSLLFLHPSSRKRLLRDDAENEIPYGKEKRGEGERRRKRGGRKRKKRKSKSTSSISLFRRPKFLIGVEERKREKKI